MPSDLYLSLETCRNAHKYIIARGIILIQRK
jgi:hypothetical protein